MILSSGRRERDVRNRNRRPRLIFLPCQLAGGQRQARGTVRPRAVAGRLYARAVGGVHGQFTGSERNALVIKTARCRFTGSERNALVIKTARCRIGFAFVDIVEGEKSRAVVRRGGTYERCNVSQVPQI